MLTMAPREKKRSTAQGRKLAALRIRLGLTQAQAAERVGVKREAWNQWETGRRTPSGQSAKLIELLETGKL